MSDEFFKIFFDGMTEQQVRDKLEKNEKVLKLSLEAFNKTIALYEEAEFEVPKDLQEKKNLIENQLKKLRYAKAELFGIKKPFIPPVRVKKCCSDYNCLLESWDKKTCKSCGADCTKCKILTEELPKEKETRCRNCYWCDGYSGNCLMDLDPNFPDDMCPDPDYFKEGVGHSIDQHDYHRCSEEPHKTRYELWRKWKGQAALHKIKVQGKKKAREQGGKD